MGTRAILQKGRGRPGLTLPANAVAKINESNDRSGLERVARLAQKTQGGADKDADEHTQPDAKPFGQPAPESPAEPVPTEPIEPPEPKQEPTRMVEQADTDALGLTRINGIGPRLAERLANYGFKNVAALAAANPTVLDEIQGVNGRGDAWVRAARELQSG